MIDTRTNFHFRTGLAFGFLIDSEPLDSRLLFHLFICICPGIGFVFDLDSRIVDA
jgi:hypothetical protein